LQAFAKPLLALLITILIFTGFIYLVNEDLLEFVEARFYNPSVVNSYVKENAADAEIIQNHINNLQSKFDAALTEPAVRSSFLYNQSPEDIYERSKIFGMLMESTDGLQSVQFVDSNGIRLHYSTSLRDIVNQNQNSTAYRNYNENPQSPPYEIISVQDGDYAKLTMDELNDSIIFSFPFKDSMDVYHGTALFTVSVRTLAESLIARGRLKVSDNISVINEPSGILSGGPETSKTAIHNRVSEIWSDGIQGYVTLDAEDSGMIFSLITSKTNQNIFFGRLVSSHLFAVSEPMKLILKVSIFLTFFLAFFFLLNVKPNPVTIVRNRLKRLRESLFDQLDNDKSVQEKTKWILELEQRRDEIKLQLKRNIKLKNRLEANINGIIDISLDKMLVFLKAGSGQNFTAVQQVSKAAVQETEKVEEIGEAEDIEELGEVEAIEETGEVKEVEDIEELGEIEEINEVKAIGETDAIKEIGEVEKIEGISEVKEAEEIEEIGEVKEIGEIEAIVEADAIKEIREVETIEEVEGIEKLGEAEAVEVLSEVEEIEKAEPVEVLNKIEETNIIDIALKAALENDEPRHRGLFWLASKFAGIKPVFQASKGLLSLASKKASKKAVLKGDGLLVHAGKYRKTAPVQGEGLLAHANKYKKTAPVQGDGLLVHAGKYRKSISVQGDGLLVHASKYKKSVPTQGDGLLVHADKYKKSISAQGDVLSIQGKGLLALASEMEANINEVQDIIADIDVVSPFSDMFSDLKE
jgi:hypothetical protein